MHTMTVTGNTEIADGIYSLVLCYEEESRPEVTPGQFVMIYPRDSAHLLGRPISICEYERESGVLRLVFRVSGEGTRELSELKDGDRVRVLGPLGNGYPVEELKRRIADGQNIVLLGGGIGIPPMLGLAKSLGFAGEAGEPVRGTVRAVLGYRDSGLFLSEEFSGCAELVIATEDGSCGTRGTVLDAMRENGMTADVICACGPLPMLRAVKTYAQHVDAYLSLEERMACGIGVCLGCVCKTAGVDPHSKVNNARVCTEGPVFRAEEVVL